MKNKSTADKERSTMEEWNKVKIQLQEYDFAPFLRYELRYLADIRIPRIASDLKLPVHKKDIHVLADAFRESSRDLQQLKEQILQERLTFYMFLFCIPFTTTQKRVMELSESGIKFASRGVNIL